MEGYLRPGCVHVTVQAIVDQNTHDTSVSGGIANVVRQLIARAKLLLQSLCCVMLECHVCKCLTRGSPISGCHHDADAWHHDHGQRKARPVCSFDWL